MSDLSRTGTLATRSHRRLRPSEPEKIVSHTRIKDHAAFEECYDMGEVLGKGSYGIVYEAKERESGKIWAVKIVDKKKAGSTAAQLLDLEIAILKQVEHEYIVQLHEVYETPKKSYLVMELCGGGELVEASSMKSFAEDDAITVIQQLAEAVVYLHASGIVHRDLKLENIMLKEKVTNDKALHIKITDFGLCAVQNQEINMQMLCGTPIYMAPEVLENRGNYSPLCDIWSIGVILYQLISKQFPFKKTSSDASQLECIQQAKGPSFAEPQWSDVRGSAKSLVCRMLEIDPARRITAREILDDPWLTGDESSAEMHSSNVLDMMKEFALSERLQLEEEAAAKSVPSSPIRTRTKELNTKDKQKKKDHPLKSRSTSALPLGEIPSYMRGTKSSSLRTHRPAKA